MLARLLHIANSSPLDKERFYAMKSRILHRFASKDGTDLQELPGKPCWSCDGTGIFTHIYSGDEDECHKCYGDGWFKRPCYVTLQRWRMGRFVFHEPIDRCWGRPPVGLKQTKTIKGYVEHRRYSYRQVRWATLLLALCFDWPLASLTWNDIYRCWWIVRMTTRRCIDCKRRLWSTRRWKCRACEFLAARAEKMRFDEIPF